MIDLQPFCGTDQLRHNLHKPWSRDEFTYASDGRILVRVPRRDDVMENPSAPNTSEIFKKFGNQEVSSAPAIHVPEPEKLQCSSCHGIGTEHDCPDCSCKCEECGGAGEVEKEMSAFFRGVIVNARYLAKIAALPELQIASATSALDAGAIRFTFDGGEGVVCTMRTHYNTHIRIAE